MFRLRQAKVILHLRYLCFECPPADAAWSKLPAFVSLVLLRFLLACKDNAWTSFVASRETQDCSSPRSEKQERGYLVNEELGVVATTGTKMQ